MQAVAPAYLDYNATVPVKPAVRAAVAAALDLCGNPSSVHRFGRAARRLVEEAREAVAALAGAPPAAVVFTGGGTEANNLALAAAGQGRVLVSAVEHDSVRRAAAGAEIVPVDADGVLRLDALAGMLRSGAAPSLLSLMLVNNETGLVQPVREAAALARAAGARVHCDAVQAAGRLPLALAELGVDYLTVSAHKLGGPAGVGALVARDGAPLAPAVRGGGQERGRRAGTENLLGIAGFGAAAPLAADDLADQPRLAALRDRLESQLEGPVYGRGAARVCGTSCIGMPGVASETQVMAFDLAGIAVSAGAACSSGKVTASHVLAAMGVPPAEAGCAVRVSFGWATTAEHIDRFVTVWRGLRARLRPAA